MTLLLDTSILVSIERGNVQISSQIKELARIHPSAPKISFVTQVEFLVGLENAPKERKPVLKEFLWRFPVLHTSSETAFHHARLKAVYDSKGKPKSFADLLIASQAIEHKLTLVTQDADFADIQELSVILL